MKKETFILEQPAVSVLTASFPPCNKTASDYQQRKKDFVLKNNINSQLFVIGALAKIPLEEF